MMPKQHSPARPGDFQAPPAPNITKFRLPFPAKVLYSHELPNTSDFGKWLGTIQHVFVAENFDACFAGIVIRPDCPHFERNKKNNQGGLNWWALTKLTICVFKKQQGHYFQKTPKRRRQLSCMCVYMPKYQNIHVYINNIPMYPYIHISVCISKCP